jgi:hypothetical protein
MLRRDKGEVVIVAGSFGVVHMGTKDLEWRMSIERKSAAIAWPPYGKRSLGTCDKAFCSGGDLEKCCRCLSSPGKRGRVGRGVSV